MRTTSPGIMGSILRWCVALLCALSLAGAQAALSAADPPASVPAINLSGANAVSLYGKSQYWIDAAADRSVDQVEAQADTLPWKPLRRDQHGSLHGGALWIAMDAQVPAGERWFLEVGLPIYESVTLYHRDARGQWASEEAGHGVPVSAWGLPGRLPTFQLDPDARKVRYWLRVQDDRADFSAAVMLYRLDALQASREREQFFYGAYFGFAGLLLLASVATGLFYRDKAFLAFSLYILLLASGQLARAGVGAQHIWPDSQAWNGAVFALWPGAAAAGALWFVRVVTEPARLSRALDLGVLAMLAALLAAVAVDIVVGSQTSVQLVLALTGLSLVAVGSMVVWGWLDDGQDAHLRLIAIGFLPVLLMALFPLGRAFGLFPASVLTRSGLFFAYAVELPILYYALNMRLMARQEAQLRARALSRTDPLTGLPHRQGFIERLDSSLAHARAQKQNCAVLGVRISNLDAIAEEFGRDNAEKALVVAASHLRRIIVGFDMAARVGEREFALLLEAPLTSETVSSRAQQVVASGLRQVEALPQALTLKFHVTAALLPDPHRDGAASLQWVLDGLDAMTQDARKLIRPLNF